jgi:hypothetical protein
MTSRLCVTNSYLHGANHCPTETAHNSGIREFFSVRFRSAAGDRHLHCRALWEYFLGT